jgi:hypothetical protein
MELQHNAAECRHRFNGPHRSVRGHTTLTGLYRAAAAEKEQLIEGKSEAYRQAKSGDADAAADVVEAVLQVDAIVRVGEQFPNPVVAAVHAEEALGRNQLPMAYAVAICEICEFDLDEEIVQANRVFHTGANARQRLRSVPRFDGDVIAGRQ